MKPIYLDLPAVATAVSLSEATIQKLVREHKFPKPRVLSDRRVAWLTREIETWAEACPVSDLAPPPNTGHGNRRRKTCVSKNMVCQSASDRA
ncbi:helix-turn-helix transcriptional regulator [Burkholderia vietnamiensis]|uniref:helix-turn-helix transcriptional regulator n=1 Tax=Burkholderia vietnamiensis TaxID=60552 RepID=UPI0009BFDD53|nr:AlpA family phage regulatory protein [Burkholderia vietnamiensis]MDN7413116.1 AlpA family phage regulatory protein [Burkholderia vietnamiensis]MDN7816720.1 AlpA family phage regulatory protein [Burkholderia vietnamiensis]QTK86417.1 AlpA family phage regulatory protein [Burkholderia vietnamiensis]HDR9064457.1 AlpA family phage regulatory protein [Burkholderia vietnamiensis]HDR9100706.1 AlpA family phage regulatory protein [Burkholderia vietnamiensis]